MNGFRLLAIALGIGLIVIFMAEGSEERNTSTKTVRSWKCPPGKPYRREDGFGPYAPSWPTYAVIRPYASDVPGAKKRAVTPDSTLFFLAHPGLKESNLVEFIPNAARFATPCRGEASGCWVRFSPPPAGPKFVLVEATGGSCGDWVRIFSHGVAYGSPHVGKKAFQDHSFSKDFERRCVVLVLIGDTDGDGFSELIVKEMVEDGPSRSQADKIYGYRIIKPIKGEFKVVGELDDLEIKQFKKLRKLR